MSPDGRAILGVPGYPVSAAVVADLFLRPLLARLLGEAPRARERVRARTTRAIPSRLGLEEFIRVSLGRVGGRVGDRLLAAPLARGAGAITTLTRAQGYLRIAENLEGVEAGAEVEVELLVPREEVEETLLHVGSHDPALDVLGDLLRARRPAARLASSPVGSIGGILAAAEGTCHFAGSHLLDPESGTYNLPYLDRLAPGADLAVVTLAHRTQGLVVARGNPLGLRGVEDLARARFVNRQRGSGTRILLDHLLGRASVDPGAIRGYAHEEFTHMAVASAVATGAADTGLAVLAATRALGLDFVPLGEERYDLVLPRAQLDDPRVQHLIDTMVSSDFRAALARLGGYDVRENGKRWR
jgi:putative molybdopterin biosynthesis protein